MCQQWACIPAVGQPGGNQAPNSGDTEEVKSTSRSKQGVWPEAILSQYEFEGELAAFSPAFRAHIATYHKTIC